MMIRTYSGDRATAAQNSHKVQGVVDSTSTSAPKLTYLSYKTLEPEFADTISAIYMLIPVNLDRLGRISSVVHERVDKLILIRSILKCQIQPKK